MNTLFKIFISYNILQYVCDFIHVLIFVTVSKCRKSPKLMNIVIHPSINRLVDWNRNSNSMWTNGFVLPLHAFPRTSQPQNSFACTQPPRNGNRSNFFKCIVVICPRSKFVQLPPLWSCYTRSHPRERETDLTVSATRRGKSFDWNVGDILFEVDFFLIFFFFLREWVDRFLLECFNWFLWVVFISQSGAARTWKEGVEREETIGDICGFGLQKRYVDFKHSFKKGIRSGFYTTWASFYSCTKGTWISYWGT